MDQPIANLTLEMVDYWFCESKYLRFVGRDMATHASRRKNNLFLCVYTPVDALYTQIL